MEYIPYGPQAGLVRFASVPDASAFRYGQWLLTQLKARSIVGLGEWVPALTTLLCQGSSQALEEVRNALFGLDYDPQKVLPALDGDVGRCIDIPTRYAGPDLEHVAQNSSLSVEEVIERHTTPLYRVHCLGFAPGFPYLGGLDARIHTPRKANPRPRVPAGSVAIGGSQTGIYSIANPGGWNLIGDTQKRLFCPEAIRCEDMFLLRPGDHLRFVPCEQGALSDSRPAPVAFTPDNGRPCLRILSVGNGLTLQDAGRPGFARFGVPISGAMDPSAADWANRLLDNPQDCPVLELGLQGQRFEALEDGWIGLAGSAGSKVGAIGVPAAWSAFRVRKGQILDFPAGQGGVWSYLATPGGFLGDCILGSVCTHPRAGFGQTLSQGQVLWAGAGTMKIPSAASRRRVLWSEIPDYTRNKPIRVWPGPQWSQFSESALEQFLSTPWTVSSQSDRVGYRLSGPALEWGGGEQISEPVLPGTVQVPSNGQPIVTMPDGPTLGGYPKIGWIDSQDLPRVAQTRPGQFVRFQWMG